MNNEYGSDMFEGEELEDIEIDNKMQKDDDNDEEEEEQEEDGEVLEG